jgi:hypothetical protein
MTLVDVVVYHYRSLPINIRFLFSLFMENILLPVVSVWFVFLLVRRTEKTFILPRVFLF